MSAKKEANFQWAGWSNILFFHGYIGEYATYGVMTELAPDNSTKLLFPKQNWSWIKYHITIVIYPVSTSKTLNGSAIIRILMLTFVSSISKQCKNVKIYKHLAVATNLESSISYKQPYSGFTRIYTLENSSNLEIHLVKSLHMLDVLGMANI